MDAIEETGVGVAQAVPDETGEDGGVATLRVRGPVDGETAVDDESTAESAERETGGHTGSSSRIPDGAGIERSAARPTVGSVGDSDDIDTETGVLVGDDHGPGAEPDDSAVVAPAGDGGGDGPSVGCTAEG